VLDLRTADDVFLQVGAVTGIGRTKDVPPVVARRIAELDWHTALGHVGKLRQLPDRPLFDVVASLDGRRTFNRYDLENATGAALAPILRGRHLARTGTARPDGDSDLTVRLFVHGPDAAVALRLADRPLHRRPWKLDTGPGTLHPPVAAALVRMAGVATGDVVADPFCGDGTIAVEAALTCPDAQIVAADIDPARLANATANAERAGVAVELQERDAGRTPTDGRITALLTNPPWNVAVDAQGLLARSLDGFWNRIGEALAPEGRYCLVADADLATPDLLRRDGHRLAVAVRVRLAGRVLHLVLGAPPNRAVPQLSSGLVRWREQATDAGIVDDEGFR